jgi:hypothetical protein
MALIDMYSNPVMIQIITCSKYQARIMKMGHSDGASGRGGQRGAHASPMEGRCALLTDRSGPSDETRCWQTCPYVGLETRDVPMLG